METLSYGEFSLDVHQAGTARRLPLNGAIEVTHRCPLECLHCYNNLPMEDAVARRGELSLDEHRRIADEIAEAGCLWLLYTGGEVFARPDFLEIYEHAHSRGLILTLFTNGTLITPRIADRLAARRPFAVEITLYGATRETYERLTGIAGSYDRCLRGIRLLTERGIHVRLKTVAVTVNRHEVWDMQRLAEQELGLSFKFDSLMNARIDCSHSPLATRLRPEEVVAFDLDDPRRAAEWVEFARHFHRPAASPERPDELYTCGGGLSSFAIDPQGRMSLCLLSKADTYDLRRGSFREGWEQFLGQVRRKKITRVTKCTACHLKAMCGMCPANGELENRDPEAPIDYLCQVAHLRAHAFGLPVPAHGECEYCPGGEGHAALLAAAERLRDRPAGTGRAWTAERHLLPMLGEDRPGACGPAGCGSCGAGGG